MDIGDRVSSPGVLIGSSILSGSLHNVDHALQMGWMRGRGMMEPGMGRGSMMYRD